jgi:hypothetical protein
VATYIKPVEDLNIVLEYLFGSEHNLSGVKSANLFPPLGVGKGVFGDETAQWQGFSGIISIGGGLLSPYLKDFSLAVRGEVFDDRQGTRIGVTRTGGSIARMPASMAALNGSLNQGDTCPSVLCPIGSHQQIWEVTVTGSYRITEGFLFRVEYRHDDTNRDDPGPFEFDSPNFGPAAGIPRFRSGQDTIALQAAYVF